MEKYSSEELLQMDPVEVYKLVLSGTIARFPRRFFKEDVFVNYKVCAIITRYLIEEILKWDDEDIKNKLLKKTFYKNGLRGMIDIAFNSSPYKAIENCYPGRFKPWQLKSVPQRCWDKESAKEATKWLIEEILKWNDEDIKIKLCSKIFHKNGLGGMLQLLFNNSPYDAIENCYPGRFKPWEFKCIPNGYWNKETAAKATRWLIEEKLKWTDEDIKNNLSCKTFHENGLFGMLVVVFNYIPYEVIENCYPGRLKPWEFKSVPNGYWNKETAAKATRWLIEEKLKWNDEDIIKKLSRDVFYENGLIGMLNIIFNGNSYEAISNAYPGKYKKQGRKIILA